MVRHHFLRVGSHALASYWSAGGRRCGPDYFLPAAPMGRPSPTHASFGVKNGRGRSGSWRWMPTRLHVPAVTERMKQAHPELDAVDLWQAVSQNAEERAAWRHRQKRRRGVARTHERTRWKREDFAHQHSRRIVNECDVIAVNPAHTSQDCSGCGNRTVDLTLGDRVYRCVRCGLVIDRDLNASRNILAVGRHCLGLAS